jgi:hypothetical protein
MYPRAKYTIPSARIAGEIMQTFLLMISATAGSALSFYAASERATVARGALLKIKLQCFLLTDTPETEANETSTLAISSSKAQSPRRKRNRPEVLQSRGTSPTIEYL